jgi:hypothetical protein
MKKLLLFVLPLFIFSCKSGINAHKDAINKLDTDWTAATKSVTDFAQSLTGDVTSFTEQGTQLTLDSMVISALKGDNATKYKDALNAFKNATSGSYAPVQNELNEFVSMWTEKSGEVSSLKAGLESGKYEGDALAKITELTSLITQGTEKVNAWKAKQAELKTAGDTALSMLKSAYEAVNKK